MIDKLETSIEEKPKQIKKTIEIYEGQSPSILFKT